MNGRSSRPRSPKVAGEYPGRKERGQTRAAALNPGFPNQETEDPQEPFKLG